MESSEKGVNIQFSDKALTFIKTKRLNSPLVLISLGFRSGGGDSSGCGGGGCSGGGGCGGEGDSTAYIPYPNVVIVDGKDPGADFLKVDTQAGIPVYMSKAAFNKAKRNKNPLSITLRGLVMKKLSLEGLDLTSSADRDPQKGTSCH